MTGRIRRARSQDRIHATLYALSPARHRGRPTRRAAPTTSVKLRVSCCCPGATDAPRGSPRPSETSASLVPKPPRDRPSAWSKGSSLRGVRRAPPAARVARNDRRVHAPQRPIEPCLARGPPCPIEQPIDHSGRGPLTESAVDRLPGAEPCWQVTPWSTRREDPEHAVEHAPRVPWWTTRPSWCWEQVLEQLPGLVGERNALHESASMPVGGFVYRSGGDDSSRGEGVVAVGRSS